MCVCVCVCVCEVLRLVKRQQEDLQAEIHRDVPNRDKNSRSLGKIGICTCVCVCARTCVRACVCVCVCPVLLLLQRQQEDLQAEIHRGFSGNRQEPRD